MSGQFAPDLFRPLPRPLAPFPQETLASFRLRLAVANRVPQERLKAPSRWIARETADPLEIQRRLALQSGQPPELLWRRLPELRWHSGHEVLTEPGVIRFEQRWACRRCAATHTTTAPIKIWAHRHLDIRLRHKMWNGKYAHIPQQQIDLVQLPGTVRAYRQYLRLLRRHGDALIAERLLACGGFWKNLAGHYYTLVDDEHPARLLINSGSRSDWGPMLYAMAYPSVIIMISMMMTPRWRSVLEGIAFPRNVEIFMSEFQRRIPPDDLLIAVPNDGIHRISYATVNVSYRFDQLLQREAAHSHGTAQLNLAI